MTRLVATFLAATILPSCTILTKQQQKVVAQAESIGVAPIRRDKIIKVFGLNDIPSQRLDGSVRGGRMYFTETWEHSSGLSIKAFDSEYVGELKIVPGSIDAILNKPGRKASDFVGSPAIGPTRQTFQEILILRHDKAVFRSTEYQGESGPRE